MSGSEKTRKIAVIFVADVVGYSKHMEKDEDATLKAYDVCEKILNKLLKKYVGSIFNTECSAGFIAYRLYRFVCTCRFFNDL